MKVNIAVVGETGVGKSSFVNYFRGVKENPTNANKFFATESSLPSECTTELVGYPFKGNKNLKIWDLPGANSPSYSLRTYK